MTTDEKTLLKAIALYEKRDLDGAMDVLKPFWKEHPNDPRALNIAGLIYEVSNNIPLAYNLFKLAKDAAPTEASYLISYGRTAEDLWLSDEAMRAYNRALSQTSRASTRIFALANIAALKIDHGLFDEAKGWVEKALKIDPENQGALANLGFCQLATGDWANGWKNYRNNIGTDDRRLQQYSKEGEPLWDGSPGQCVVFYGEQGLGDEIVFASMTEDASRLCRKVILDCDPRLENLFKRSFPQCTVYGTRGKDRLAWAPEDQSIDAVIPSGQVGEFVRTSMSDCPQQPWLVPDAFRVQMWKDQWKKIGKPVIGIAWSGGIRKTGAKFRYASLEKWKSILDIDAHFVSLEYRPGEKHPKVHEYPFATRTSDYDDTAALVASLDLVVSVPTSVVHLAGAVGTKVIAMHGPMDCWKYASGIPFHHAEHVQWQGDWSKTLDAAAEKVRECISPMQEAA